MSQILKPYFDTEGPFGLPMKDAQARALEARLKTLPRDEAFAFRRCTFERGLSELLPGDRADVSWITEETPDRAGDIVRARGMDDSHFAKNPIVTLNHDYAQPPVGRSLWRKRVREGTLNGIKAKTFYPPRPDGWNAGDWPPDVAFPMVQAGLLRGKSIGFVPLQVRPPRAAEGPVRYVIEAWLLVEYACCFLPMQPNAVVEQVAKALPPLPLPLPLPFTDMAEIARAAARRIDALDLAESLEKSLQRSWNRARGIV